jgi:predicted HicB family RNase H-like nuclease
MPAEHKTMIRLPKELHTEARIKAIREGKTLSAVVRELLEQWLKSSPTEGVSKKQRKHQ